MARLSKESVLQATQAALAVSQDPAVVKAWKQAGQDMRQASRSTADAARETREAWRRTG